MKIFLRIQKSRLMLFWLKIRGIYLDILGVFMPPIILVKSIWVFVYLFIRFRSHQKVSRWIAIDKIKSKKKTRQLRWEQLKILQELSDKFGIPPFQLAVLLKIRL